MGDGFRHDAPHLAPRGRRGPGAGHAATLSIANLGADEVDYVNAHGTGTPTNDRIEALAIRRLLGDRVQQVACSSTKPVTGHCLGASAALEAVIAVLCLQRQLAPPTVNCREPDPECSLNLVTGQARPMKMRVAMSNSLGFWGKNASLIFASCGST